MKRIGGEASSTVWKGRRIPVPNPDSTGNTG